MTRFLSIAGRDDGRARVRVDFTGDLGHEIGRLDLAVDAQGLLSVSTPISNSTAA